MDTSSLDRRWREPRPLAIEATETALDMLEAFLRRAAEARNTERDDRLAARAAVLGFVDFVSAIPAWREDGLQLAVMDLLGALEELDRGHVVPMLKSTPSGLGAPVFERSVRFRAFAAGAMGGLMKYTFVDGAIAAEWVAKRMRPMGQPITQATVENWRKEALKDPQSLLGKTYLRVIEHPGWRKSPLDYAERLTGAMAKHFSRVQLKK